MLFVKLLLLVAGGGTVAGLTYTQVKKTDTEKTIVVSNNQESKIRARLEKNMQIDLLKTKKTFIEERQASAKTELTNKNTALDTATKALQKAYEDLNTSKTQLKTISDALKEKYSTLTTQENELKNALVKKMAHELEEESKKLKKEFYESQKDTYEKEKASIKEKISAIDPTNTCATAMDVCTCQNTFSLNMTSPKTQEEIYIESEIKKELNAICSGLSNTTSSISFNSESSDSSKEAAYTTAESTRVTTVNEVEAQIQKYNHQIIDIHSKEYDVSLKLLQFQHAQVAHNNVKQMLEKHNNEFEIINEQIKGNSI